MKIELGAQLAEDVRRLYDQLIRLGTPRTRLGEIFVKRGMVVDFGGSWLLPRLIGMQRAKELAFFGDFVSATEARDLGLVNRVVPSKPATPKNGFGNSSSQ